MGKNSKKNKSKKQTGRFSNIFARSFKVCLQACIVCLLLGTIFAVSNSFLGVNIGVGYYIKATLWLCLFTSIGSLIVRRKAIMRPAKAVKKQSQPVKRENSEQKRVPKRKRQAS